MRAKRVIIAAAGTGGHVLPAQALARELVAEGLDIHFVGKGLTQNRCFDHELFAHKEIASASPFARGQRMTWPISLLKGYRQSLSLWRSFSPDLVVGFGSYYTVAPLLAAIQKKTPIYLYDSNAIPGRVTRLFAPFAVESGLQFSCAAKALKGKWHEIEVPSGHIAHPKEEAREHFGLDRQKFTLLIMGGSQGAEGINRAFLESIDFLHNELSFQVIHIAGEEKRAEEIRSIYREKGIRSYVCAYEKQMDLAWSAADAAITRSGASTIAEQIAMGVPTLFIPLARAAHNHQLLNARAICAIKGAEILEEINLSSETLKKKVLSICSEEKQQEMRKALSLYREKKERAKLLERVMHHLEVNR